MSSVAWLPRARQIEHNPTRQTPCIRATSRAMYRRVSDHAGGKGWMIGEVPIFARFLRDTSQGQNTATGVHGRTQAPLPSGFN
jgi:hypothetical protein